MVEILSKDALNSLINYATEKGFGSDIQLLLSEHANSIDIILVIIEQLEKKIQNRLLKERLQNNIIYVQGTKRNFDRSISSKSGQKSNEIYAELTKVYYLVRTLITGETIDFIEVIDGHLKTVHQKDWIDKLSGTTKKQISLYSSQLKDVAIEMKNSTELSVFTRISEKTINSIIEWASFNWHQQHIQVGEYKGHPIYQKLIKDNDVYAYYSGGKKYIKNLLYQRSIFYNLGQLQETILTDFESYASIASQAEQLYMLHAIQNSQHPISYFLTKDWTPDTVPGTVQGDFRSASGQWFQSKRKNSQVITTYAAHNAIVNLKIALLQLKEQMQNGTPIMSTELIQQFTNMFNAEQGAINDSIKNKIQERLIFMGQSII